MLDEIWRQMSFMSYLFLFRKWLLYENIDQILPNKLHGPMNYKIDVTCVNNGHVFYTLLK